VGLDNCRLIFILIFPFDQVPEIGYDPDMHDLIIIEKIESVFNIVNGRFELRRIFV
jgi:hypothetical protein